VFAALPHGKKTGCNKNLCLPMVSSDAEKPCFIEFFQLLMKCILQAVFDARQSMGTSWNAARCQPIETKETLR